MIDEVFKRQTLEIENPNAVPSDAVHGIENGNSDGSEMSTPVDTNVGRRAGNGYIPTDFNIHLVNLSIFFQFFVFASLCFNLLDKPHRSSSW